MMVPQAQLGSGMVGLPLGLATVLATYIVVVMVPQAHSNLTFYLDIWCDYFVYNVIFSSYALLLYIRFVIFLTVPFIGKHCGDGRGRRRYG